MIEKIKFYDTALWVSIISLLFLFIFNFLEGFLQEDILSYLFIIDILIISIVSIIFNFGMIYYEIKSKSYGWLFLTIVFILFFIELASISLITFYFVKMRKEFKKRKGVCN